MPKPLRQSHIIPEFVYSTVYDDTHRFLGINGLGKFRRALVQKGLREPLLCDDCEQFINVTYEKPFKHYWYDKNPLPAWLGREGIQLKGIDYAAFKLFHLSILFRAGAAQSVTFHDVQLGPHQETLRTMLLEKHPAGPNEYSIMGFAIVDKKNAPIWRLIIPPFKARYEGHNVYQTLFGGCMWIYKVSVHHSTIDKAGLQPDGFLWLLGERWETVAAIQAVSRVLNRAKARG